MYIRTIKSKSNNITYVYLVKGYRDTNGKVKQRIIKNLGILEELDKDDPNILEKLQKQAKLMESSIISVDINTFETNSESEIPLNYGYFFLERL